MLLLGFWLLVIWNLGEKRIFIFLLKQKTVKEKIGRASVGCFHSFQYLCKPFYEAINIIERRKPREAHMRSIASSDNSRQKSKADFVYSTPSSSSSRLLCKARRRDLKNHSVWLLAGNTVHSSGSSQEGTLMQSV